MFVIICVVKIIDSLSVHINLFGQSNLTFGKRWFISLASLIAAFSAAGLVMFRVFTSAVNGFLIHCCYV